jgi:uncharacterized membrane protein
MLKRLWARVTSINVPLAAAAVFAAAILHILATLATPYLTPASGYSKLASGLPENAMMILPPVAAGAQPLPFLSPDARYAVCRFDTKNGSVNLTAVLPEPGWVLSIFSPAGDNFFSSVASADRPQVSVQLVPGEEIWRGSNDQPLNVAVTREATLTIPANSGIVVIRAPDRGEAYAARAMAELKRARCQFKPTRPLRS